MSEMSATVLSVEGAVVAMSADGMPRVLQVGEKVLPGETVVAGEGASLQLLTVDGDVVPLASGQRLVFGEEMIEATRLTRADAAVDPLSVEAVLQAIEAGQALDDVLEAPAAGLAGGGEGEGSDYVRLGRVEEDVTDPEFEYVYALGDEPLPIPSGFSFEPEETATLPATETVTYTDTVTVTETVTQETTGTVSGILTDTVSGIVTETVSGIVTATVSEALTTTIAEVETQTVTTGTETVVIGTETVTVPVTETETTEVTATVTFTDSVTVSETVTVTETAPETITVTGTVTGTETLTA
ncbi:MAG: retention module-containing protein, partial [Rhodocyclaceae bacterium]|nr:retention module-containing protein [Rhodocyclaceae bacterium]